MRRPGAGVTGSERAHAGPRAGAAVSLQQPIALVSAGAGHRLRDGVAAADRAVGVSARRERQPRRRQGRRAERRDRCAATRESVRTVEYAADRPVRYLACVISRFVPVARQRAEVPAVAPAARAAQPDGAAGDPRASTSRSSRRRSAQRRAGRSSTARARSSARSRRSWARRRIPTSRSRRSTTTCPADTARRISRCCCSRCRRRRIRGAAIRSRSTTSTRIFFLAHEVAHQWWGQAVGWKNYHEQWLSEGLAQYFAVLYAGTDRGPDVVRNLLGQMRAVGGAVLDAGPDLARLSPRPHSERRPRVPRHRLQQVRGRAAHAAAADRRRGVLRGHPALLRREPVSEGGHRRFPRRDRSGDADHARALLRSVDHRGRRSRGSTSPRASSRPARPPSSASSRLGEVFDLPLHGDGAVHRRPDRRHHDSGHRGWSPTTRSSSREPSGESTRRTSSRSRTLGNRGSWFRGSEVPGFRGALQRSR